jgi:hypothetical protein
LYGALRWLNSLECVKAFNLGIDSGEQKSYEAINLMDSSGQLQGERHNAMASIWTLD